MEHQRHGRHPDRAGHLSVVRPDAPAPPSPVNPFTVDLVAFVGDTATLARLDAEPLGAEAFDWSAIEPSDRGFVARVVALTDEYCATQLDLEYATIARRLFARVAERDPRVLRRSPHVERTAAALVWLTGRANRYFGPRLIGTAGDVWAWFGVTDCAARGRSLRRAAGLEVHATAEITQWFAQMPLGDASLLHSEFRAALIAWRDAPINAPPTPISAAPPAPARWTPRSATEH